jgi:hypothetical protein
MFFAFIYIPTELLDQQTFEPIILFLLNTLQHCKSLSHVLNLSKNYNYEYACYISLVYCLH